MTIKYLPKITTSVGEGITLFPLPASAYKFCTQFVPKLVPITHIGLIVDQTISTPDYEVRLETINHVGEPNNILVSKTFTPISNTFMLIPLDTPYLPLNQNQLYITVQHKSGTIDSTHYAKFCIGQGTTAPENNILLYTNRYWKQEGLYPSAVVQYSDNTYSNGLLQTKFTQQYLTEYNVITNKIIVPFYRDITHIILEGDFTIDGILNIKLSNDTNIVDEVNINSTELTIRNNGCVSIPLNKIYSSKQNEILYITVTKISGNIPILITNFINNIARNNFVNDITCSIDGEENPLIVTWIYPQFDGAIPPAFPRINLGKRS